MILSTLVIRAPLDPWAAWNALDAHRGDRASCPIEQREGQAMKAVVVERYGPPDVLQLKEVAKPVPKDNGAALRVGTYAEGVDEP